MKAKVSYEDRTSTELHTNRLLPVLCSFLVIAVLVFAACKSGGGGGSKPPAPDLTGTVTISGTLFVGQTLTANTAALDGNGTISYQWKQADNTTNAGSNIGTNSDTYVLAAADVGKFLKVAVTRAGYSGSIESGWAGPIFASAADLPDIERVTVSAASNTVTAGQTVQFTAIVHGTDNPLYQYVSWSIETPHAAQTTISSSGLLTVATDETALSITVRATSAVDSSKYGEAQVLILSAAPTVSSVSVDPPNTSIGKGKTGQFTAKVTGTGAYSEAVTWAVEGGIAGTSIANGLLTVAAGETAKTLTVKATSAADTARSGTATVTVTDNEPLTGVVIIRGYAQVGMTLRADTSNLGGTGTISYQWKRGAANIGTNSDTYTLVAADQGSAITVTVTRTGNAGEKSDTSNTVLAAPAVTGGVDGTVTIENGIFDETVDFTNTSALSVAAGGTITVTVAGGWQSYRWFVDGLELSEAKGSSLLVRGSDYPAGSHRILVIVYKGGVPYSHEIPFTRT